MGTPGISGIPLILGMSVRLKNLIRRAMMARKAKERVVGESSRSAMVGGLLMWLMERGSAG